jgi:N-methylhydantoinase A
MSAQARVGVDVGGTFTDLVALAHGRLTTAKVLSTPRDQSAGVLAALGASGLDAGEVSGLAHGTTVATNALLERRGARTALVTTEGFRDLLEIGRQNRPSLYDLTQDRPHPLVPREFRFTVRERMGPEGELVPLDEAGLARAVEAACAADVEAVAVCLLFAYLHPEHERKVGEALRAALPGVRVSLSSEVLPEFREYERFATTVADAYVGPRLGAYLAALARALEAKGFAAPAVMQSSGGVTGIEGAIDRAAACVLSGPAGGVVGAAFVAGASGYHDLLTFDMGGTSTDVAPVVDGTVQVTMESIVGGVPIRFPTVDVHSVSAGGGSVAGADEGGALRVGPRSAGADPGPASYGRGGSEPTVTDANLLLGYLADGALLGGELRLRRELAERALAALGKKLGLSPLEAALGVVRVADAEMTRALRVISVERGLDPREFVLVAFGGAGPLHACALAEELGIRTVLVPKAAGVLSALGLAVSELRRDYVAPFRGELVFEELERRAATELSDARLKRLVDARYRGQAFELTVPADEPVACFHAAHERRYGFRMEDEPVELVNLRVVATVPWERPPLTEPEAHRDAVRDRRRAYLDGGWVEVDVVDRGRLGRGARIEGPAVVEFPEATCLVRPGWAGEVDAAGTLVLEWE